MSRNLRSHHVALALLVAVLLAVGGIPRPDTEPGGPALLFLSPNTDEGLTVEESVRRLDSAQHRRYRQITGEILEALAVGPAHVRDALGEWNDGAENSLLVVLPQSPDLYSLCCAAAWFGLLADQKAVLVFRPDPRGRELLATLHLPGSLAEVRQTLDRHWITSRTILVAEDGYQVFVVIEEPGQFQRLGSLSQSHHARMTTLRGHGVRLEAPTRAEARRHYREVLRGSGLAATRVLLAE